MSAPTRRGCSAEHLSEVPTTGSERAAEPSRACPAPGASLPRSPDLFGRLDGRVAKGISPGVSEVRPYRNLIPEHCFDYRPPAGLGCVTGRRVVSRLVAYELQDSIAMITMDDGKANVLSLEMLTEVNAALDRAAADRAVVVLSGRDGIFSGGFDLGVIRAGGSEAIAMVRAGFELAERTLSFPMPIVIACTGHAVAMGAFLLLSGDYRVGALGPYKYTANEVAIGLTMPLAAIEILRQRLAPAQFNRAAMLAEPFSPQAALEAGFLDQVVEPTEVQSIARAVAVSLSSLDMPAHFATKLRVRAQTLETLRAGIDADHATLRRAAFSVP